MKAYVLHGINDFRYENIEKPKCPKNWAIVKVKAAGICSSDIPRIFTKGTYHFPTIPGHEFAGIVDYVSNDTYSHLVGEHVGVFPLIPCRKCSQCVEKHYEMCNHYDYVGSRRDGGFAEYVAVPIWNLIPVSKKIPFEHAAMLEPLSVALHAVKISGIKRGDRIGIVGTGMIGISAAQWAKQRGASEVTIIGRNESKRSLITSIGLDYFVPHEGEELPQFDVVIEAVGFPSTINLSINLVSPGGTLVLMGNPSGNIDLSQTAYWRILRKQIVLRGTWNSSYDGTGSSDWTEAVKALEDGSMIVEPLISHRVESEKLKDGIEMMYHHAEPYCKVMTIWN